MAPPYILEGAEIDATSTIAPGSNDNIAGWSNAGSVYIGTQGAPFTISGIIAPVSNVVDVLSAGDGKTSRLSLLIINDSGQTMTVTHQDVASLGANRIITASGGGSLTIATGGNVVLMYSPNRARWYVVSKMP